jgi:hypothetical protein
MKSKHSLASSTMVVVVALGSLLAAAPGWAGHGGTPTLSGAITLPGGELVTAFDISFVDPVLRLYLLGDRTNKAVDVIDPDTNTVLTPLGAGLFTGTAACSPPAGANDCAGPNGVLTVNQKEVWAGDGNSTVKVFDLSSGTLTHTIPTGGTKRADELCFDPVDQLILMANDADTPPFLSFIPTEGPSAYTVVKTITMDGTNGTPKATNGIEQCQWSPTTGKFYVNIPEVSGPGDDSAPGATLVISPTTMAIVQTFNLPHSSCAGPQGMAIGPSNQILLGCNASTSSVLINQHSGAVISILQNEGGPDEVWFNEGDGHYYLAQSSFSTPELGVVDSTGHKTLPGTPTGSARAHSVAADSITNQIYVPIPSTATAGVCGSGGGTDSLGCIAVYTSAGRK